MEVASYMLGAAVVVLGFVATALSFNGHKYSGLWVCALAIVLAVLTATFWLHDRWQKEDAAAAAAQPDFSKIGQDVARIRSSIDETAVERRGRIVVRSAVFLDGVVVGQPLKESVDIINTGASPVVIKRAGVRVFDCSSKDNSHDKARESLATFDDWEENITLAPNTPSTWNLSLKEKATEELVKGLADHSRRLFIVCEFLYDDIHGKRHTTRGLYEYVGEKYLSIDGSFEFLD